MTLLPVYGETWNDKKFLRKSQLYYNSFCSKSINGENIQQHTISVISTYTLHPVCNPVGIQGELPHSFSTIFVVL